MKHVASSQRISRICIGLFAESPPPYDKAMTAILQELKFLHMQSASQGELHIPYKDFCTAVMTFLLCRHFNSVHNSKNPFHQSEESSLSDIMISLHEQNPLCRFTLEHSPLKPWCAASSSSAHCSYIAVVCTGTHLLCAVGHYFNLNNKHYAAGVDIVVGKRQSTVVASRYCRPCTDKQNSGTAMVS